MAEKCAPRMVIAHSVDQNWQIEHLDIHSAFLHEEYGFHKPLYTREIAKTNGSYSNGKTVWKLVKNQYGNPSGAFYYLKRFME